MLLGCFGQIEAIVVHHFRPCRNEVVHELLLRVRAPIDFGDRTQLGVRTEDEVDAASRPLAFIRLPISAFVDSSRTIGFRRRLPLRSHVEQVDEEVVRQRFWLLGEYAMFGIPAFAPRTRRPPTRTVISGAVSRSN